MSHRNEDDPTPREVDRARRQLERAGLGDLADDTAELATVRHMLPPVNEQPRAGRWIGRTSGPDVFIPADQNRPGPWFPDEAQRYAGSGPLPGEMRGDWLPTSPGQVFEFRGGPLGDVESSPDAYSWRPPRAVPRPYGGRLSDPWGRAWCDCGEPVELHAHIPGSYTGAWCYAPREVRRPGERAHRVLRALALLLVGSALGLLILYAIVVGIALAALTG
jgi:hypothetical protein